jgi:5'-nucleotidase
MKILLTNDDGIYAEGLWALYRRFASKHFVVVIAPEHERTAVGHGITLNSPIRAEQIEVNNGWKAYAISGTPVDCIKLGMLEILESKPDMVISGINPGANVGVNINYSGTVSAAREAALYGIPAIAVSMIGPEITHYDDAARFVEILANHVENKGLPNGTMLNVNIPDMPLQAVAGVRISRHSVTFFPEYVEKRIDPRNRVYYWHGCDDVSSDNDPEADETAVYQNYISITPIKCDMTDYRLIEDVKNWDIDRELKKERAKKTRI